jgi:hypothetical protein
MTEQLSCEGDGEVGSIPALLFLHLASKDQHFGGRVLHLQLSLEPSVLILK